MHMYKHTFTQVHPYTINTHICTYTCMYAHTHIYMLYTGIHTCFTACGPLKHQRVMSGRRNHSK